jgi:hypothetical protein
MIDAARFVITILNNRRFSCQFRQIHEKPGPKIGDSTMLQDRETFVSFSRGG